ncbi:MAG: 2,3-bisphosphoglycerate-independent phosphoglycerate mutase [Acholeplasmatales bacterium]|nr:MAG: 2,3-bisphosphoglycerate-independent phosphoglycerate mutase [Acholeplasmatales bacterium]
MKKPVALIIMDGWGEAQSGAGNAVTLAKTPVYDHLKATYPFTTLNASGLAVGLPEGQMGNSEVGHLNIGGGRIVYQSLTRIHKAIEDGSFYENPTYQAAFEHVKAHDSKLHLMGLLSDGGVHSHITHFDAMLKAAKQAGIEDIYVHAFLDGRDVPPQSALSYVKSLEKTMANLGVGVIASVHGRYYAMDRDKNWTRTQLAYDVLTEAKGRQAKSATAGIKASYDEGVVDEFVIPFNIDPSGTLQAGDAVIHMNFRPDRAIQLSTALTNPSACDITPFASLKDLHYVCTMHYSELVKAPVAFDLQSLDAMYGEAVSAAGLKQLRIAETEKYAHVTFFFDGGEDKDIAGSTRILVPSPKVATYDMQPEMSAYTVTEKVLEALEKGDLDTIILNFANCDMVGHTGVISAAVKAVETTDTCVGRVVDKVVELGGVALVTADHGNAEQMLDAQGGIHTAHTTNRVPFIITDSEVTLREDGILADIAPTMLAYLGVTQPGAMTGKSLLKTTK